MNVTFLSYVALKASEVFLKAKPSQANVLFHPRVLVCGSRCSEGENKCCRFYFCRSPGPSAQRRKAAEEGRHAL